MNAIKQNPFTDKPTNPQVAVPDTRHRRVRFGERTNAPVSPAWLTSLLTAGAAARGGDLRLRLILAALLLLTAASASFAQQSAARQWDEEMLNAIRHDLARPPVHARNLFHVSVAMYDGWAVYDAVALRYLTQETHTAANIEEARAETISYAAYRVLRERFVNSPGAAVTFASFNARMAILGYDTAITTTIGDSPAEVGNRIAANVIAYGLADGSNEQNNYAPIPAYQPVNQPLIVALPGNAQGPGNPNLVFPNRWQSLALSHFVDQNGHPIPTGYPAFICPHWGHVIPFALTSADEGPPFVYHDPGPPPLYGGVGDAEYKSMFEENLHLSSQLTPDDGITIDISPGARGNSTLGTNDGQGYPLNPVTGQPYAPNIVKRGDYGRVLAEFWADGPSSETPPGHWNVIANYVSDYPGFEKRFGGIGPILDNLEWDVKVYMAINGAVHDAAITAWGAKGYYDTVRPISAIRYMADLGQSSDPGGPSYHPGGLPLEPGVVEVITAASSAPGERHSQLANFVGEIAVLAWPGSPPDPVNQYSGVRWIRAKNWVPYQKPTFVTPPFAGYISGHSTYSRAAAEVMTRLTGTEFFPGGMGTFFAAANSFLTFERGPSQNVTMQWATYYDAADEAGLSRLWGGIHPRADDLTGRTRGSLVAIAAFDKARELYTGVASCTRQADVNNDGHVDGADFSAFLLSFGYCTGELPYSASADLDGDGCVTLVDYQLWLQCFHSAVGNPLAAAPTPTDRGDINGDGQIDGLDVRPFVERLLNPTSAGLRDRFVADFTGDGQIDSADVPGLAEALLR